MADRRRRRCLNAGSLHPVGTMPPPTKIPGRLSLPQLHDRRSLLPTTYPMREKSSASGPGWRPQNYMYLESHTGAPCCLGCQYTMGTGLSPGLPVYGAHLMGARRIAVAGTSSCRCCPPPDGCGEARCQLAWVRIREVGRRSLQGHSERRPRRRRTCEYITPKFQAVMNDH